jgi:hypothetical protein
VVKPAFHRVADVHVRAFADALEAFEFLDLGRIVCGGTSLDSAQVFRVFLVGHAGEKWWAEMKVKLSWKGSLRTMFFFFKFESTPILGCQPKIIV